MVSPWMRSIMAPGELSRKKRWSSVRICARSRVCISVDTDSEMRVSSARLAISVTARSRNTPKIAMPTHQIAPCCLPTKTRSNSGFSIQLIRARVDPSTVISAKASAIPPRCGRR